MGEYQIREHQQFWIMLQNHFVNLTHKRSDQLHEIQVTRKRKYMLPRKQRLLSQSIALSYEL